MKLRSLRRISLLVLATLSTLAQADPSARVGRISSTQGAVTFRSGTGGDIQAAAVNWPVTSNNELITDGAARAEFRVGSAAIRLDGNTDLEILQLDDNHFRLRLNRGGAEIHIRNRDLARDFALDTPQGHLLLSEPTQIRIDARYDTPQTSLIVQSGSASFDAPGARFSLQSGQHAEVVDGDLRVLDSASAYASDDFDRWSAARERQDERSTSARYVSAETTGYEELDSYGAWRVTSQYGPLWSPAIVPVGWAPYRDGSWTWIAPWGWTWVDNSAWGYAPSHYGRWVYYDQRWCWTPGAVVAQPVWAPAVVGWVGGRSWEVGFNTGSAPAVGWFPLAPREVYVPGYQVSPTYVQQINNTTIINSNVLVQNGHGNPAYAQTYQNQFVQNAVTVMPQSQFSVSKTVMVTPTSLSSRQVALMHAAPVSAITPLAAAPRAVSNPPTPAYLQRSGPGSGALMQARSARPLSAAAVMQAPQQFAQPARSERLGERSVRAEAPFVTPTTLPSRVLPVAREMPPGATPQMRVHPNQALPRPLESVERSSRADMHAPAAPVAVQSVAVAAPPPAPSRPAEPRAARPAAVERMAGPHGTTQAVLR